MAFTELESARVNKTLQSFIDARRPPPHLRSQLDLGFEVEDQEVLLFEQRPDWQDETELMRTPVAKLKYVRKTNVWKLYWMRSNLKWHPYEPCPEATSLERILEVVGQDELGCFWG